MASSTRLAVALLTAAVSLVPMACGGDEVPMRATLTNDGCTYEGDTSPAAGMFTIEVENQTELSGSFVLLSLPEGWTVDDLQPALDQYPRQFERGWTLPEPPDYQAAKGRLLPQAEARLIALFGDLLKLEDKIRAAKGL